MGLSAPSESLPARSPCPVCRGDRLTIYQDTTTGSDWGYCFDCKFRGDMIELAAATWKVSIQDAANRLAHSGVPIPPDSLTEERLATYITRTVEHYRRLTAVWEKSRQQLLYGHCPEANTLRRRLGLTENFSRDRLRDGPAKLFGVIGWKALQNAVRPCRHRWPGEDDRLLHGPGWRDLLLVPHWSAPGRIAGFYVIGRHGNLQDRVYVPVWFVGANNSSRDAGLAGLEAILDLPAARVIAVQDQLLLLRLQMRNFHHSLRPLPMVAWYAGPGGTTGSSWSSLGAQRVVHWARKITAPLLLQCQKTGGDLVLAGPQTNGERAWHHFLRSYQPSDLTQKLLRDAKPWQDRVARWLREAPEAEVTSVIHHLTTAGHDARALFYECDPKNTVVKRQILPAIRQVNLQGRLYTERNGRWYSAGKKPGVEKLLLNGVVRFNHIVLRGPKRVEYHGVLHLNDRMIPFMVYGKQWYLNLLDRLNELALQAGVRLYWSWRAPIHRIALAFHEPQIVKGKTGLGWTGQGFRFRHFTIRGGQSRTHEDWLLPDGCPGPQTPSSRLTKLGITQLGIEGLDAQWGWAMTISVLSSILAPSAGLAGPRTLVVGKYVSQAVEHLLSVYGIPTKLLHYLPKSPLVRTPKWPHRWPLHLRLDGHVREGDLHAWLLSSGFPWAMVSCEPLQSRVVLCHGGYVSIEMQEVLHGHLAQMPMQDMLLAYLRDFSRRWSGANGGPAVWTKIREDRAGTPSLDPIEEHWRDVQHDLAAWLTSLGGNASQIRLASRWAHFQNDPDHLSQMIVGLYHKGLLRPRGQHQFVRAVAVEFDERGLIVPPEKLAQALRIARLSVPEMSHLTEPLIVPHASF